MFEPFIIRYSVHQGCPLTPRLYVLPPESLLRKLARSRGIPWELTFHNIVSAYADDIAVIASRPRHMVLVNEILKEDEAGQDKKLPGNSEWNCGPAPGETCPCTPTLPLSWNSGPSEQYCCLEFDLDQTYKWRRLETRLDVRWLPLSM